MPFFFFNVPATTEIYTLSLHDALPISRVAFAAPAIERRLVEAARAQRERTSVAVAEHPAAATDVRDRKSTRLNSSHSQISYAVFCLKKKKNNIKSFTSLTW